jgi:2-polyprenyl-3-methyl-5-hydroxy-6-metoxy-1,4-benzoquinol methylase
MSVHERYARYTPDQRRFFDELITEEWDTYLSPAWDFTRQVEVEHLLSLVKPRRILDIGCGCGYHDLLLAAPDFVERVDAIDYSAASVERAEAEYPHPKVVRWTSDVRRLEGAEQYDLVTSFQVFEHLDFPEAFLATCARLCRRGGWVAIATPNRLRLGNLLRMVTLRKPLLIDPQHFREYTVGEIVRMGERHGLRLHGWFGYGLSAFASLPFEKRVRAGQRLRRIADGICVVMQRVDRGEEMTAATSTPNGRV